jgi:hypothetical protein
MTAMRSFAVSMGPVCRFGPLLKSHWQRNLVWHYPSAFVVCSPLFVAVVVVDDLRCGCVNFCWQVGKDWSAMELRAEGEVCGVEWLLGDRGSVCGCGGLLLPGQSPPGRFGVHSAVRRTGAHAPRRNCADNEQSGGSDGSDRRTACADQACEVEVVADSGYLRRGVTEFLQRWRSNGWKAASGNPGSQSGSVVGTGRTSWLPSRDVDSRGRSLRAR